VAHLEISEIPELEMEMNIVFDTEESDNRSVIHPAFVPVLLLSALIVG
jgi:hypothetical protein